LQVLLECRRREGFVQEILDRHLAASALSGADRRLATQLAYGVLRRRGTLDALLRPLLERRPQDVEDWLWDALRLGAYQLLLLNHVPAHAALHETVELAAVFQRPRAKGFLNAILRKLSTFLSPGAARAPAADALPLEHGFYRKLARPVLPEPAAHPVEYLAVGFAWPTWLAQRWLERFGWDECVRLGFWFAGPAPLWVRYNPLRSTREALLAALAEAGSVAEAGEHPQAIRLSTPPPVRELPGYEQGWFTVQDQSAMRVGSALSPEPGSQVLDLCAAPGGKATHLAELMGNQGQLLAADGDEQRLQTLRELARRLGITIIETRRLEDEAPRGPFDSVLVDVPCSNTGVLGRRPEVRWRLRPDDFRELFPLQTCLLTQGVGRVRPGGVVVYSTCSIEPEENQQVVYAVLRAQPCLTLEAEEQQRPGCPADGGYWARLRRTNGEPGA
jgi:16S rRNA (cytosine967-C5)-methyltransferase